MEAPQSICPGYKQVEAFGSDDEYEEEEEVVYVTLDMGNVEPTLVPSSTSYRLIGLDTSTPFLQLQGTILKGRHDLLLGTELIFTDDKESHDWAKRSVVHVANTEQRIAFQEVTLIPKGPASTSVAGSSALPAAPAATAPKNTKSKGKGKQKAVSTPPPSDNTPTARPSEVKVNFEPPAPAPEELEASIDRLSGLTGPIPRASRSRRGSTVPRSQSQSAKDSTTKKDKGKGKERPRASTRSWAKGKAKETEEEEMDADADADGEIVDEDAIGEDVSMEDSTPSSGQPPQAFVPPDSGPDGMYVDE